MDRDFELNLKLNFYDVLMFAQAIAHARRYGDNQLSDWAADVRERLQKLAGGQGTGLGEAANYELDLTDVTDSSVTDQAKKIAKDVTGEQSKEKE